MVTETQETPNGCCMQISEVEFLGTAAELPPGDGNLDGVVDGLDYLVWASYFGDDPAHVEKEVLCFESIIAGKDLRPGRNGG